MASITIGGVALNLVAFDQGDSEWRGDAPRAFDNTLQDGRDNEKRNWSGTTDWITPATYASLRTAIAGGAVSCSGVVLGETVTCSVEVKSAPRGPDVLSGVRPDWTAINVTLSLTLREV
jgi:hypothetical protein